MRPLPAAASKKLDDIDPPREWVSEEITGDYLLNQWALADSALLRSQLLGAIDDLRTDGRVGISAMTDRKLANEINLFHREVCCLNNTEIDDVWKDLQEKSKGLRAHHR